MRRLTWLCCLAVLTACAENTDTAEDTAYDTAATVQPSPLGAMAGTWEMTGTREGTDSVLITYRIVVGADGSTWELHFPDREPVQANVMYAEGDSVVVEAGPYESALRKGVMVSTHTVFRMQGSMLTGHTEARYDVTTPDSLVVINQQGSKVQ